MTATQHASEKLTGTILEASEILGTGLNQTYEAARRGEIPTMRVGRRLVVKWQPFLKMLKGDASAA
jgi:excisionase family DNA binding protein